MTVFHVARLHGIQPNLWSCPVKTDTANSLITWHHDIHVTNGAIVVLPQLGWKKMDETFW